MTTAIRCQVLGPLRLFVDGEEQLSGGPQLRQVLALLVAANGATIATEELIDRIWPEDPPATARKTIQTYVSRLRDSVGDALRTTGSGYALDLGGAVDAVEFEELAKAGRAADDPVAAVSSLRRALDLWHGTPYGGLGELDAIQPERLRLEELRLAVEESLYDATIRTGAVTEMLPTLKSAVAEHPLRDRLRRQLMLALYRSGRQADALRTFQNYRDELADVGLEPPAITVELEQRIARNDPELLDTSDQERPLRGYRIDERLGEGAFSVVYRGTQPSVGRDVAIKQIRAELANRPEFIRRFEAEAHMVARLEHPHIVPLIDYWREPGSAYLVMRLLRGGSLESSVLDGRWTVDRTVTMAGQIGSALAAAHRNGIVHRDVKSANILLDDDGHAYLSDFGIALEAAESADPAAALSTGSPAYASPEQLRREPVGPPADVHGLAIAIYEALTGRLPFPDEPTQAALLQRQLHDPIPSVRNSRTDIPPAIDDVLKVATAKSPADRYATVEDFLAALHAAVDESPAARPGERSSATFVAAEARNPYKGLLAFHEADAADFTGRDRLVDQLVTVLDEQRAVTVVGPSGSGKSSVVRAGLVPALRSGRVAGSGDWYFATVMPGSHPFEELEASLTRLAADQPTGLLSMLQDGERGIGRAIRRVLPEDGQLLLVIDQFEELFTLCDDEAERQLFLDGLASALAEERSRVRVVLTLRADFYDRPLRYKTIGRLVRDSTVAVLPLAADELERAIVDPATAVGAEFEPGLVSEIVADVADQPGALPMLQYALTQLYERRVSGMLTRSAYHDLGGVTGALARRAEELYVDASPGEQAALRQAMGRLVTLGEGVEDTRRRVLRSELGASLDVEAVIAAFGAARLLSFDRDPATREPTVEVAHEALLREWPRLRTWFDDDRDTLRTHRHLTLAATEWDSGGRDSGDLYRGARLELAETLADEGAVALNTTEQFFLDSSIEARRRAADLDRRRAQRTRRLLQVTAVIAVLAVAASIVAFVQQGRADDEAARAEAQTELTEQALAEAEDNAAQAASNADAAESAAQEAAEEAIAADLAREQADIDRVRFASFAAVETNPALAALLASEAYRLRPDRTTEDTLQRILAASSEVVRTIPGGYFGLTVLDDRHTAITGTLSAALSMDLRDGTTNFEFDRPTSFADRTTANGQSDNPMLAIWGPAGTSLFRATAPDEVFFLPQTVADIDFATDGDHAAVSIGGNIEVWNIEDPASPIRETLREGLEGHVAWNPDGRHLLIVPPSGPIEYWDTATSSLVWEADSRGDARISNHHSLFRTDGSSVLVVQERELANGYLAFELDTASGEGRGPSFFGSANTPIDLDWLDGDETIALAAANSSPAVTINLTTRAEEPSPYVTDAAWSFAVLPETGHIAEAGNLGIRFWSTDLSGPLERRIPIPADLFPESAPLRREVAASADGTTLFLSNGGFPFTPIYSLDLTEAEAPWVDTGKRGFVLRTNDHLFMVNAAIQLVDDSLESTGGSVPTPPTYLYGAASPDGSLLAYWAGAGTVLVNATTGVEIATLIRPDDTPGGLDDFSFAADSETILVHPVGGHEGWATYSTQDGSLIESGPPTANSTYRVLRDGVLYLSMEEPLGVIQRLDPATFDAVAPELVGHWASVFLVERSSEHGLIATRSFDSTVRVWDETTGNQLGGAFRIENGWHFDPHTPQLLGVADGVVSIWNFDTSSWLDAACELAGRNMSRAEWEEFGPKTVEYRATCPQFPIEE